MASYLKGTLPKLIKLYNHPNIFGKISSYNHRFDHIANVNHVVVHCSHNNSCVLPWLASYNACYRCTVIIYKCCHGDQTDSSLHINDKTYSVKLPLVVTL